MDIYKKLSTLTDTRTAKGKRHAIEFCVMGAIMAIMSGYDGFRAYADFIKRHQKELIEAFKVDKNRVPSNSTIRRVLQAVDPDELAKILIQTTDKQKQSVAIDGKASKGSVVKYETNEQDFTVVATAFLHGHGIVIGQKSYTNKDASEIDVVHDLIDKLKQTGVIYTMDALHAQKNDRQDNIAGK